MIVFLCEEGFDGILCGVYDAYRSGLKEECLVELEQEYEPRLFAEYRNSRRDGEKAGKTAELIRKRMSEAAYEAMYRASLHKSPGRADAVFRFFCLGMQAGRGVMNRLSDPAVYEIFKMDRYVGNEAHLLTGFTRFERLLSGMLYGVIGPENDVLELVAGHFADRLSGEAWILFDEKRRKAAVHRADGRWAVLDGVGEEQILRTFGRVKEDGYSEMWNAFFRRIAVEERYNPRCQRNLLPLRYRKYMTEFSGKKV